VTAEDEWVKLWSRHAGKPIRAAYGGRPAALEGDAQFIPALDFDRYMVIAIATGASWNSDGIQFVSAEENADRILFRFDHWSYQTAGPDGGGVRVAPFGFFVLPRSAKPIVVEENVQGLIGHPPKWKERARFDALAGAR
jgi:hypothetical protein